MNTELQLVLDTIGAQNADQLQQTSRYYREVNIGRQAARMGLSDLAQRYRTSHAVVLISPPDEGMKVRIDGRTFVDYAQFDSRIVVPGYVAREAGLPFKNYTPEDSMVLVF